MNTDDSMKQPKAKGTTNLITGHSGSYAALYIRLHTAPADRSGKAHKS